ncbi:MAG: hypothetical protein LH679_00635 [Cyanobacteria bacterium CAN_BIN43]|nr:hypothetical protein [Cyanobacteria bacterium CAN_BIN43]
MTSFILSVLGLEDGKIWRENEGRSVWYCSKRSHSLMKQDCFTTQAGFEAMAVLAPKGRKLWCLNLATGVSKLVKLWGELVNQSSHAKNYSDSTKTTSNRKRSLHPFALTVHF